MKNKIFIYLTFMFLCLIFKNVAATEKLFFDTSEINISNEGNIINATKGTAKSIEDNIEIEAESFKYNQSSSVLMATKGTAKSIENNIEIEAENFKYNQNLSTLNANGNVKIKDLTKNISLKSESVFYNIREGLISSEKNSYINDNLGNSISMKSFVYTINDGLVKINMAEVVDLEKNIFKIKKAYLNLNSNKLIGKDVSIDFNNIGFHKDNEPRLKGNSISSNGNKSIITKGVFTLCKRNDDCPPWQLSANEIQHDKEKKIIYYKDAWLKLYDKPVFYFPRFFHPDPTVKRQSGFLMPTFQDSSSLGSSLIVPYYRVLSDNKDLTINPRLYSDEKILLQTEYRQVDANANHTLDFSVMNESGLANKSHFFSNSFRKLNFSNFDDSELSLKIEQTSNDTYLKAYKIESPIMKDTSLLESSLSVSAYRDDLSFDASFQVYEDLTKENSDRYEYIFPSYSLFKQLDNKTNINGNFLFNSSGYLKNYDTNIYDKVLINDLIFNSDAKITNIGFRNNYNLLIKNINTDSENSKKYKGTRDHKIASIIEYNSSYPLKKETDNFINTLKPMLSLKYSPNNSKDMKKEDRRIDVNNIFSLNRIGRNDAVEGGASLTYGAEFSKVNKLEKEIFGAKIANIFRAEEDENLPRSSQLGEKTSNIVGSFNYSPTNNFKAKYDYSLDSNLTDTKYQLLTSEIKVNNFITTFEYLNENNTSDSASYLANKTEYSINDATSFLLETRRNKKTKLTEFYNLMYQYRNDCLIAAIQYNKDFYSDRDLKPEENIFLKLTIIPFGQTSSPNIFK